MSGLGPARRPARAAAGRRAPARDSEGVPRSGARLGARRQGLCASAARRLFDFFSPSNAAVAIPWTLIESCRPSHAVRVMSESPFPVHAVAAGPTHDKSRRRRRRDPRRCARGRAALVSGPIQVLNNLNPRHSPGYFASICLGLLFSLLFVEPPHRALACVFVWTRIVFKFASGLLGRDRGSEHRRGAGLQRTGPAIVIDSDMKAGPGRGLVRLLRVSVDPTDLNLRLESLSQPAATGRGVRTSVTGSTPCPPWPGHITAAACTVESPNIMNRIGVPPRVDAFQISGPLNFSLA